MTKYETTHLKANGDLQSVLDGVAAFSAEMKAMGIHVAVGIQQEGKTCITCDQPWPCPGSRKDATP